MRAFLSSANPRRMEIASMLSFLLCFVLGFSSAQTPSPVAPPAASALGEDPSVTALARKIYSQMRAGKVEEGLMTDAMNQELRPSVLMQTKPVFDQLGDPIKLTLESRETLPEGTRWVYLAVFAMAQLHVDIFIAKDGKVGGYRLAP